MKTLENEATIKLWDIVENKISPEDFTKLNDYVQSLIIQVREGAK